MNIPLAGTSILPAGSSTHFQEECGGEGGGEPGYLPGTSGVGAGLQDDGMMRGQQEARCQDGAQSACVMRSHLYHRVACSGND